MRRVWAIVLALSAAGVTGCSLDPVALMHPTEFDAERWKEVAGTNTDERFRMVPHLLRDHRLIGRSPAQVTDLLGRPWTTEAESGFEYYHYRLGNPREEWGTWGYPFLSIEFADGRALRVFHLAGMGAVSSSALRQE